MRGTVHARQIRCASASARNFYAPIDDRRGDAIEHEPADASVRHREHEDIRL